MKSLPRLAGVTLLLTGSALCQNNLKEEEKPPVRLLHPTESNAGILVPENWTSIGTAKWSFQNGTLSGGQGGDPKRSGLLLSKAKFKDFDLSLEFKIDEHGKYNSGIYLRYDPKKKGDRLQVNIGRGVADEPVGLYLDNWLDKGDASDAHRIPNEWNALRIKALGPHIQVWLNGQSIVDYQDPERLARHLETGHLAFQTYGAEGHAGWVKFRKMTIKPIKKAP